MRSLTEATLYTFIDTAYLAGRAPAEVCRQLCAGGSDLIQLRAKGAAIDEVRRLAEELLPVTNAAGIPLVINDHPAVAIETGAAFAHLGQEDFFDAGHRRVSDLKLKTVRVGLSTHAPDQAERALAASPDYIAIGPVYATGTKPGARPVTLDYVRWATARVTIPWFAIGGIHLQNLDEVLAAGARRICVVSAILKAPDVARACQAFKKLLPSAPFV